MKTIIFDIEGTLTDVAAMNVKPKKYPLVDWIVKNRGKYNFVYATGGQEKETLYVLEYLGIKKYFDLKNSINKTNYRFSKKTGLPFKKIKKKFPDCILVADSQTDFDGAKLAGIECIKVRGGKLTSSKSSAIFNLDKQGE